MSRAVRMGIGLVSLIPVMAIAIAALLAIGVEGAAVGWLALGIGFWIGSWIGLGLWSGIWIGLWIWLWIGLGLWSGI